MRLLSVLLPLFATLGSASHPVRNYDTNDYYAIHIPSHASPADLAERLGLSVHGRLGELKDHWLLEGPKQQQDVIQEAKADLKRRRRKRSPGWDDTDVLDHLLLNKKQEARQKLFKRAPVDLDALEHKIRSAADSDTPVDSHIQKGLDIAAQLEIKDPGYPEQWHLYNPSQVGHDINVTGVWLQGITGKGSISAIVDDGLDFESDDLRDNYFAAGSWDFNDPGPDPKPRLDDDRHGTRCAGEIGAVRNDICGVGVAYDSKVAGVRILSGIISDADEAISLNYAYQQTQIYSCSWGPPDDGKSMEAPGILIKRAMLSGVQNGRDGLGSLFVFAIGNGASNDDNCNFDGYTNSIYSVSVGGIDRKGLHPYYSEKCSAQLVVTYSSGSGDAIHTTEVGKAACNSNHGGTSAAGPLVVGAYALVLEVRPDLNWRDFQYITALTAVPIDTEDKDWQNTAMGLKFNHQYGFGKMDVYALVEMAKNWTSVKPQAWYWSPWMHVRHDLPQGEEGLSSTFEVTAEMLTKANLERLEHVTVTMNVEHTSRGELSVDLISPFGVTSHIATTRRNDKAGSGYRDWTFMSVAHWGESGIGTWTVVVKDTNVNEHTGKFVDWRLRLWGESIDAASQGLLPMPNEDDDNEHDSDTTTAIVATTTHGNTHPTGEPEGNPEDHQDRPVAAKPTTTSIISSPLPTETNADVVPGVTPGDSGEDNKEEEHEDEDEEQDNSSHGSGFLPLPFPTFNVSKSTQVWIYGTLGLIAIFCTSLGAWYFLTRHRRLRDARDEYEFQMLDENDADDDGADNGLVNGANGFGNGAERKGKRRAGELYDAFAEGSEEEDVFSVGDEEEEHDGDNRYRDEVEHKGDNEKASD